MSFCLKLAALQLTLTRAVLATLQGYMDSGSLVPSELIVDLVKDRLTQDDVKEKGCLLDGFPRAPDQAQAIWVSLVRCVILGFFGGPLAMG